MQCTQCQFDNPPGMKFCGQCGQPLPRACPQCGTPVVAGFKFCGECGTPLSTDTPAVAPGAATPAATPAVAAATVAPARAPNHSERAPMHSEGVPTHSERKPATVLACELVADGGGHVDAEDLHSRLNRFLDLAREEIRRYEGTLGHFGARGFLALFGAPIAHEDHAQRAALTALALQRLILDHRDEFRTAAGVQLSIRIGLDTGEVVVGGSGDLAVGDAIDHAEELRRCADGGQIRLSSATALLVADEVEVIPLDGDNGDVFELHHGDPEATETDEFRGTLSPFVGRRRELDVLEELRELAAASQGQIVGVSGEAGAGKSRLMHEFRKRLQGQRISYLLGQCRSYGPGIPYLPLQDMVRRGSHIARGDDSATLTQKLRGSLENLGVDLEQDLPPLLQLLGVEAGTESLQGLEPQALRQRQFAAMRRMLLQASRGSLVVIVLEDLHWIDSTSEEFLASIVEGMAASRILLLLTYRSGYQPPWMDRSYATQIPMRRLSVQHSREILAAMLRRSGLPDADVAALDNSSVLDKAEGNPFFLEELARALAERASQAPGQTGPPVPDTIQGVLMARIDRLPERHKHLLQTASVLGREFSGELLQGVWGGESGDASSKAEETLQELQRWEFLHRLPTTPASFAFRHALTQEVAYQSLLNERRQALHARAASVLEGLHADHPEAAYDRLAYHYPRAGNAQKTVHYLSLFARHAASTYAHAEAVTALTEALGYAERLPAEERDRRSLELLLDLVSSLFPLARFPQSLEVLEQHRQRLDQVDDAGLHGRFHFWLAHTHTYLGDSEAATEHAQLAIKAARRAGDEATEGKAHYVLGRDGFWAGHLEEGLEHSLRAIVLLERNDEPWWQGQAHWVAGYHHFLLGHADEALAEMARAGRIGEALDDSRLDTSWSTGFFHAALGDADRGIELCQQGVERSQDPLNTAASLGFLGYAYLQQGDLGRAVDTLRDSIHRLEAAGMLQLWGWFQVYLAQAYEAREQVDLARETAEQALDLNRKAKFAYGIEIAESTLASLSSSASPPVNTPA